MFTAWANFAMLALESQQVVVLRLMKLAAGGPAAAAEINLMTLEKLEASANESGRVLLGASPESVIKRYRKRVRSNRRRLLR
jgi:isochorismate synthase EntC